MQKCNGNTVIVKTMKLINNSFIIPFRILRYLHLLQEVRTSQNVHKIRSPANTAG